MRKRLINVSAVVNVKKENISKICIKITQNEKANKNCATLSKIYPKKFEF